MQIIQEKNELQLNGITQKGEFQFKITPQAMQMFFKDIYKDPILACIRELACNAYDAHTMNGNQQEPFNVHVPTELEPYFEVRDFGVGLSKEGMETLYSTFFESAKQHTNDLIGGLGIGSKSPLAYTDMFTAISYFNGKMYQYLITKNEFGVPTWNFVGEFDTDERNGLCINVPVKASHGKADYRDVEAFKTATIKVFTRFGIRPNMTGAQITIPNVEYSVQHGVWGVRKTNEYQGLYAIMGNIAYPINIESLRLDDAARKALAGIILNSSNRYSWSRAEYSPMNIDVNFPIGALSITPSREELQYDTRTVDAIMAKFKEIQVEFLAETKKVIDGQKTYLDAIKYVYGLSNEMRTVVTSNKLQYKGKDINFTIDLNIPTKTVEMEVEEPVNPNATPIVMHKVKKKQIIKQFDIETVDLEVMLQYKRQGRGFTIGNSRYNHTKTFEVHSQDPIIIVKDERCGNVTPKLFPYMRDKQWGGKDSRGDKNNRYILGINPIASMTDRKELNKLITEMLKEADMDKSFTIIYLSDLVEDASLKTVKASANAGKTYKLKTLDIDAIFGNTKDVRLIMKTAASANVSFKEEDIEVKKSKDVVYVQTYAYRGPTWCNHTLTDPEMLVVLKMMGISKVVSVPAQRMSNHIKDNWIHLSKKLDGKEVTKKLSKHLQDTQTNIVVSWAKVKAEKLDLNKVTPALDFLHHKCGGLQNWGKLSTLQAWMNGVEKLVQDNKSSFQSRMTRYFQMEKDDTVADLAKFFEDTKHLGNVKASIEEVVPLLSTLNIPDRYRWSNTATADYAQVVKKVVDKLVA